MRRHRPIPLQSVLMIPLATLVLAQCGFGQCVSLTSIGAAYTQNFDTLATTGTGAPHDYRVVPERERRVRQE